MSTAKKVWEDSEDVEDPQMIQEIMHDDIPSRKQELKESNISINIQ